MRRGSGKSWLAALLVSAALLTSACVVPTKQVFYDHAKKTYGWTDEQILTAWFYALQMQYTEVRPDGTRVIKRDAVEVGDALKAVDNVLASLDKALDYKDRDLVKWLDYLGMRKGLERAEVKWAYIRQRLNAVKVHGDFLDLLGLQSVETGIGSKTYDLRILFPKTDLGKHLSFTSPYIDSAKQQGLLRRAQTFTVIFDDVYAEKEQTDLYDPSKFRWVDARYGMEVVTWKVIRPAEQPDKRAGDYVEAYRLRVVSGECPKGMACVQVIDGGPHRIEREAKPILRAFRSRNSDQIDFALIDLDLKGQYGYGMPDLIKTFIGLETGADIFVRVWDGNVASLFKGRPVKRMKDLPPYTAPVSLNIVRSGTKGADQWEMNRDGFKVPYAYKGDVSDVGYDYDPETLDRRVKTVRYYTRLYRGANKVLERWAPKPEFREVLSVTTLGNSIEVERERQPEVRGPTEFFGKRVFSVVYQFGQGLDYEIRDEDGDGRFERRRAVKWNW